MLLLVLSIIDTCSEAEKCLVAIGLLPFLGCLDKELANLQHISGCQYPTGHAGVNFEDIHISLTFFDPSDICSGNIYH